MTDVEETPWHMMLLASTISTFSVGKSLEHLSTKDSEINLCLQGAYNLVEQDKSKERNK